MDIISEPQKILSLCTGMRGLELGIERAGISIQPVCYVEIEAFIIENLVQQMEAGLLAEAPVFSDLTQFPFRKFRGKIHGIVGGYPCSPFSHAGLRQGADDSRHLWPFIRRGIKESRPVWVFFENVEGHISLGLRDVLTDLRKLGYQVEVGLFSAAEVGAPHRRNRIFILGLENSFLIRMRGWSDDERENWRREIQTPRSGELGYTDHGQFSNITGTDEGESIRLRSCGSEPARLERSTITDDAGEPMGNAEHPGPQGENSVRESAQLAESGGEGLVDAAGSGKRGEAGNISEADGRPDSELPQQSGSAGTSIEGLANPDDSQKQQFEEFFREIRERVDNGSENSGGLAPERSGGIDRWPARPGEPQYDWEAPRLKAFLKPSMGAATDGNEDSKNIIRIAYETYLDEKTRAITSLHDLWGYIDKKAIPSGQSVGGLFTILEEALLWSGVLAQQTPQRLHIIASSKENCPQIQEIRMRTLRGDGGTSSASYRQECIEFLRREFANALCILSCEITLARRQESPFADYHQTLQDLWENLSDAWWDVPEALSEIQKAWKPVSEKENWKEQIMAAYKSYRLNFNNEHREDLLRMAGNAVVSAQSEKAFRTLLLKFIK